LDPLYLYPAKGVTVGHERSGPLSVKEGIQKLLARSPEMLRPARGTAPRLVC